MSQPESRAADHDFLPKRLWPLFPVVYLIHLLDERFFGVGTANWSTLNDILYFTNEGWLWVNIPSFLLMLAASSAAGRGRLPQWVFVSIAMHLLLHGLMRISGSVVMPTLAPGVVTGALLCVPVSTFVYRRALGVLRPATLVRASLVGVATLQPVYHWLLHPWLPQPLPT